MSKRTELTLLLHVFLLLSGFMIIIIISISASNYTYAFGAYANQRDDNSITNSCQGETNSSLQNPTNNSISDLINNGIMIIGHNATAGVHLLGKVQLSSLPRTSPAASEGQQPHVIPFHPKNLTSFFAEKRQAELGLIKPGVKVFAILPSNLSSIDQTK